MRILLAVPGNLKTVPMGRFAFDSLRELGHEVALFDYSLRPLDKLAARLATLTGLRGEQAPLVNRRLRALRDAFRPELFLTIYGFNVSEETLRGLRALGVPTACWWINDPFQFERSLQKAALYDWVFSNSATCAERYRDHGVARSGFLPTACAPAVHRPLPARAEFACDVCFAGDWSPLREKVVSDLARRFDIRVFGPWGRKLAPDSPLRRVLRDGFFSPDEMAEMFSSARIVLNLHTWHGRFDHGVNPRLFEAPACGAFQLVDAKREIPSLFVPGREVTIFDTLEELPETVEAALRSPQSMEAQRKAGMARALSEHTYTHRMRALLQAVGA